MRFGCPVDTSERSSEEPTEPTGETRVLTKPSADKKQRQLQKRKIEENSGEKCDIMEYKEAKELFSRHDLALTEKQYGKFCKYEEFLLEKNKVMNLTAITESRDIWVKHFLDSAMLLKYVLVNQGAAVYDIGSGAGFPAIPIAIMRRDLNITIIDSLAKRINFLEEVCDLIEVRAKCIHMRAEDAGREASLREKADVVTARAVAAMPVLCEYCLPFVREGGIFAAMKTPNEHIRQAEHAIDVLGGRLLTSRTYEIEENERVIHLIKKEYPTPKKYPRRAKEIKAKSL